MRGSTRSQMQWHPNAALLHMSHGRCRPACFQCLQDTGERLAAAEALILEGRNYLAARSTLRDAF